jgi:MFS family permease
VTRGYLPVVLAGGIWFVAKLLRYAFPPLFATFREAFAVPNAWLGGAYSAMMLVYALMQFPSGALADRLDDVRVLAAGAFAAGAGAVLLIGPPSFPLLVAAMLLVGVGTGVHKTVSVGLLGRLYPATTGRVLGVFDTFGTAGGVVAPGAVVLALAVAGWQATFLAAGLLGVGLAVGLLVAVPRADGATASPRTALGTLSLGPYLGPFRDARFLAFVGVTLCFSFAYNGAVAFLPLYLVEAGTTETVASGLYSLLFAVSVVQVATGDLSDRLGRLPLATGVLALAAAALAALVVGAGRGVLVLGAAVVAFGVGSHGFRPVRAAHLSVAIPDDVAGGGLGLVRTLLMGVGAVAPTVVGLLADRASVRAGFALLAAVMALGAVLAAVRLLAE